MKRVELLKEMMPQVARLAIVRNPDNRASALTERVVESAAKPLGVTVQVVHVRTPEDLDAAFAAMKPAHTDAVLLMETRRSSPRAGASPISR